MIAMRSLGVIAFAAASAACKAPEPVAGDAQAQPPQPATSAELGGKTSSDMAPPLEDAPCATDRDCAVTAITGSFGAAGCCFACGRVVGTRASVERRESFCKALAPKDCPALACPVPPTKAACVSGRCVAR